MAQQYEDLPPLPPELAIAEEPFTDDEFERRSERVVGFQIDSIDVAEWAMAKHAALNAELDVANRRRIGYIERIEAWFARDANRLHANIDFFSMHLKAYMRDRRDADGRTKSIDFPSGRLTSHGSQPRVTVTNDDAVVAWLEQQGLDEAVKVTKKPLVSALTGRVVVRDGRAVDAKTGEIVPGMGVLPGTVTYDVKSV